MEIEFEFHGNISYRTQNSMLLTLRSFFIYFFSPLDGCLIDAMKDRLPIYMSKALKGT